MFLAAFDFKLAAGVMAALLLLGFLFLGLLIAVRAMGAAGRLLLRLDKPRGTAGLADSAEPPDVRKHLPFREWAERCRWPSFGERQVCPHRGCGYANVRGANYCARCGRPFRQMDDLDAYG